MTTKQRKPDRALRGQDSREAERRMSPQAIIVYEAIRREGEIELERDISGLAWSGVAAGLSMGFSFLMEALLTYYLPGTKWVPLISKFGYSMGFLIVVLGRQQLFTENTVTAVLPLLSQWHLKKLFLMLRLWGVVLFANLVGACIFALLLWMLGNFETQLYPYLLQVAQKGIVPGFWDTFFSAIFAGWLIALMVWLMPFAEAARVAIIVIVTYLIGLGGFAHIIAGSVDAIYKVFLTTSTLAQFFSSFFLPALLGNILGGVAFVSILNHAQVHSERS